MGKTCPYSKQLCQTAAGCGGCQIYPERNKQRGDILWLRERQLQKEDIVNCCKDLRSKNTAGAIPPIVDSDTGSNPDESKTGARLFKTFNTTTTNPVRPCVAAEDSNDFFEGHRSPNSNAPTSATTTVHSLIHRAQDKRCANILASGKHGDNVPSIVSVHHSGERGLSLPPLVLHILRVYPFAISNHFLAPPAKASEATKPETQGSMTPDSHSGGATLHSSLNRGVTGFAEAPHTTSGIMAASASSNLV